MLFQLFYKNETDKLDLYEQEIAGCGKPCSLSHLEVARAVALPLNWEEECGLYQWYQFSTETYLCKWAWRSLVKYCLKH